MTTIWCDLPLLPADEDGPVFAEPWQAQAFAMAVHLHSRGAFEWTEWAQALSGAIRRAQEAGDADLGDTYYLHWLDALEQLVRDKGLGTESALAGLRGAWAEAAARTPHGQPIDIHPTTLAGLVAEASTTRP
ncbi:MAG: nitrile hydratase accessory protein [Burkholderiaceae bacterium]